MRGWETPSRPLRVLGVAALAAAATYYIDARIVPRGEREPSPLELVVALRTDACLEAPTACGLTTGDETSLRGFLHGALWVQSATLATLAGDTLDGLSRLSVLFLFLAIATVGLALRTDAGWVAAIAGMAVTAPLLHRTFTAGMNGSLLSFPGALLLAGLVALARRPRSTGALLAAAAGALLLAKAHLVAMAAVPGFLFITVAVAPARTSRLAVAGFLVLLLASDFGSVTHNVDEALDRGLWWVPAGLVVLPVAAGVLARGPASRLGPEARVWAVLALQAAHVAALAFTGSRGIALSPHYFATHAALPAFVLGAVVVGLRGARGSPWGLLPSLAAFALVPSLHLIVPDPSPATRWTNADARALDEALRAGGRELGTHFDLPAFDCRALTTGLIAGRRKPTPDPARDITAIIRHPHGEPPLAAMPGWSAVQLPGGHRVSVRNGPKAIDAGPLQSCTGDEPAQCVPLPSGRWRALASPATRHVAPWAVANEYYMLPDAWPPKPPPVQSFRFAVGLAAGERRRFVVAATRADHDGEVLFLDRWRITRTEGLVATGPLPANDLVVEGRGGAATIDLSPVGPDQPQLTTAPSIVMLPCVLELDPGEQRAVDALRRAERAAEVRWVRRPVR